MAKLIIVLVAIFVCTFAESNFKNDAELVDLVKSLVKKNPELRQLWHVMPGDNDGEIIAFLQITMSAMESCGKSCEFTVYYEPKDGSEAVRSINATFGDIKVTIPDLVPGKLYRVWACRHSFTDNKGKIHEEACSWTKRTVQASESGNENEDDDQNVVNRNYEIGKVSLDIPNESTDKKRVLSYLLRKILDA